MAQLPIYQSKEALKVTATSPEIAQTGINAFQGASEAFGGLAKATESISDRWQKVEDFSQTLDAKNKLLVEHNNILREAKDYNDYKNPADLKAKEAEIIKKLGEKTSEIGGGFSNNLAAKEFGAHSSVESIQTTELIKNTFREKTIDVGKASLIESFANNEKSFLDNENPANKQNAINDIEAARRAGIITDAHAATMVNETKKWDYTAAMNKALASPSYILGKLNSGGYKNLTAEEKVELRATAQKGFDKQIEMNDFNRRYEQSAQGGEIGKKAMEGTLSFDELNSFLNAHPDMPDKDKQFYAKQAGYSIKGEDLAKKGATGDKMSNLEKQSEYSNLLNTGASLVSGKSLNNLPVNESMQKIQEYQSSLNEAFDKKIITKSQLQTLSSNYAVPMRDYLKSNLSGFRESTGMFNDVGYDQIQKYSNELSANSDLSPEIANIEQANVNANYLSELQQVAHDKKLGSVRDIEYLTSDQQQKIYKIAADNAIAKTKANTQNPIAWMALDYPDYCDAVMMTMPKAQAQKVLDKAGKEIYNTPNANPQEIINKHLTSGEKVPQKNNTTNGRVF